MKPENDSLPRQGILMIAGGYGSGKTEVAVNLAIEAAKTIGRVRLADLDLVNPYFRCREAAALMEGHGVRLVAPPGIKAFADLPIILPEIAALFRPEPDALNILDVGGDDVGSRVLASFRSRIGDEPYELWMVINACRPFTNTVKGCLRMQAEIETASRLKVTGLIANAHLIGETRGEIIEKGWRLAEEVSAQNGLPVKFVTVMENVQDQMGDIHISAPIFPLKRFMLPPWLTADTAPPPGEYPRTGPLMAGK